MVTHRVAESYSTDRGGTILWSDFVESQMLSGMINAEHTQTYLVLKPMRTESTIFISNDPHNIRTSPPSDHPLWDEVEALLSELPIDNNAPTIEEENAWLDEMRSNWSHNLDTLDNESY